MEELYCNFITTEKNIYYCIYREFHSSDFFPERWFDLIVLLRCGNTELYDRLALRGYDDKKIKENIECEILEVTKEEVVASYKEEIIMELQSEKVEDMQNNIEIIANRIKEIINDKQ